MLEKDNEEIVKPYIFHQRIFSILQETKKDVEDKGFFVYKMLNINNFNNSVLTTIYGFLIIVFIILAIYFNSIFFGLLSIFLIFIFCVTVGLPIFKNMFLIITKDKILINKQFIEIGDITTKKNFLYNYGNKVYIPNTINCKKNDKYLRFKSYFDYLLLVCIIITTLTLINISTSGLIEEFKRGIKGIFVENIFYITIIFVVLIIFEIVNRYPFSKFLFGGIYHTIHIIVSFTISPILYFFSYLMYIRSSNIYYLITTLFYKIEKKCDLLEEGGVIENQVKNEIAKDLNNLEKYLNSSVYRNIFKFDTFKKWLNDRKYRPKIVDGEENYFTIPSEIKKVINERGFFVYKWLNFSELRSSIQYSSIKFFEKYSILFLILTIIFEFILIILNSRTNCTV